MLPRKHRNDLDFLEECQLVSKVTDNPTQSKCMISLETRKQKAVTLFSIETGEYLTIEKTSKEPEKYDL